MPDDSLRPSRRDLLRGALASSVALPIAAPVAAQVAATTPQNAIVAENQLPGSRDWQLTRMRLNEARGVRSPAIEGYCSRQSVAAGEKIEFKVSTNPAVDFEIEIFR